jgi:hypothetical protein
MYNNTFLLIGSKLPHDTLWSLDIPSPSPCTLHASAPCNLTLSPKTNSTHVPGSVCDPALSVPPLMSSLSLFPTVTSIRNLSDAEFVRSTPTALLAPLSYLLFSVLFVLAGSPLYLASLPLLSCIILPLRLQLHLAISTLVGKAYTLPNLHRPRLSLR